MSLCGAYCKWLSSLGKERTDTDINGVLREARGHQDAKDDPVDGHARGFPKIFSRERLRDRNGVFLLGIWRREGDSALIVNYPSLRRRAKSRV